MRAFRDQPIARKALTLGVVPAVSAVAILTVMSMTATYFRANRNTALDLEAQAAIVAEDLRAELSSRDSTPAAVTALALHARRSVAAVCVFDAYGTLFASYTLPGHTCAATLASSDRSVRAPIVRERSVINGSRQVGTVRVEGSLILFYEWVRAQTPGILGALAIAALIAFALTRRLQRVVSGPVQDLAKTADAVSTNRDYSLRAVKSTNDEVGGLVQSFNDMLDEIERQNQRLTEEITERKRAEQLKDAFLAAVSHELRTPLNAILGRLQILRSTNPSGKQLERAFESLERNARSQARLVEDLLDVSRIASGKFQMRFEVVDLCEVVSRAIDVLTPQAAAKSIRIVSTIPDTPCLVTGDSDRLQQAVMNVLSNAIKFSHEGRVTVDVNSVRGTREYVIGVQDSGVGIAPDFLPKVFERFRQADDSITRQRSGLGLGLSIVKEVVEHHGGSVLASSAGVGRGARFTIRLPQLMEAEATFPRSTRARPSSQGPPEPLQGLRVLVVDDEPEALEIAATALATAGATVGVALSGREAITRWRQGSFDALVCDLAMPDIDGFQVLDRIADFERHSGHGPIAVALTAHASKEYQHRSLAAGFHIHLPKPYNTQDLVSALAEAMEKSPPQRVSTRRTHAEYH